MKMELDHVLNQTSSKIFVKMTGLQDFKNSKTLSPDQTRPDQRFHQKPQKKNEVKTRTKGSF
jgi:hypothetical protein